MKLLIIGPQASGKGTQANLISKKLGIPHLATGEMFRDEKRQGSALWKEISTLYNAGTLIRDDLTWELVRKRLEEHTEGWILDGFPRTKPQADMLDKSDAPETVLVLEVADEVCLERISGRLVCEICGKEYHTKYKPPKVPGKCDVDGGKLIKRSDDNPDAVKSRLAQFHEKTAPLVHHYAEKVIKINGDQGIQEVWAEIQRKLGI